MQVVRVEGLPQASLDAAADFHARILPTLPRELDLLLAFPIADHSHRLWRLAAVQELARTAVPHRINAVAADSDAAISSARNFLAMAPGVTGQYWLLDAAGVEGA